jgi:hypothetical protein
MASTFLGHDKTKPVDAAIRNQSSVHITQNILEMRAVTNKLPLKVGNDISRVYTPEITMISPAIMCCRLSKFALNRYLNKFLIVRK